MASRRKKIVGLIREIKRFGEKFDPTTLSALVEVWYDSPNIDLVKDLINECELGNVIDQPAKPGKRPLSEILRELREEFTRDYV
ncbi:MAG TPA: hypothetical protein P5230_01815 [Candidatus Magasanikbacteria bacterium]|nr:hypothetical protein [Candidatus Magasanikbacteria bacterium]